MYLDRPNLRKNAFKEVIQFDLKPVAAWLQFSQFQFSMLFVFASFFLWFWGVHRFGDSTDIFTFGHVRSEKHNFFSTHFSSLKSTWFWPNRAWCPLEACRSRCCEIRGQKFLLILKEKQTECYHAQGEGWWKQWRRDIRADIRGLQFLFLLSARARARARASQTWL